MSSGPVLLEEMRRQIDEQQSALSALRSRALAILSVGALVASLFGPHVVPGHHNGRADAIDIALLAFGLSTLCAGWITLPHRNWAFSENLGKYLGYITDGMAVSPDYVSFQLARYSEVSRKKNAAKLARLHNWFTAACLLLGIQVMAWGWTVR
jgi:hypothetical protein